MSSDNKTERFTVLKLDLLNSKHPVSVTIQTIHSEMLNTYATWVVIIFGNPPLYCPSRKLRKLYSLSYSFIFYL